MKKLILLEYFTSQSSILKSRDKEIFREALNLSDSIIRNFTKSDDIEKIFVIRTFIIENVSWGSKYYNWDKKRHYNDELDKFISFNLQGK